MSCHRRTGRSKSDSVFTSALGRGGPHLVDADLQPGLVVTHGVGQAELYGVRFVLRPVRAVLAWVGTRRVDRRLAPDHDDSAAVAVGVEVQAHPRVITDVS